MTLVLVGTPIGNLGDISPRAAQALSDADTIACEDTRRTRALLSHLGLSAGGRLLSVHGHNEAARVAEVLALLDAGQRVAVVSDAGMPGISDPGERMVAAASAAGHAVEVVPGPSAVVSALVVSGLSTSRFCFEGFLPRKGGDRAKRMAAVAAEDRTVVLFEAPGRVRQTLADLAETLGGQRRVAIARELTKRFEDVWRGTLEQALEHLDRPGADAPRGEHVIVVEGAPPRSTPSAEDLETALRARLAAGLDKRAAIAEVAAETGAPRRSLYEISIRL